MTTVGLTMMSIEQAAALVASKQVSPVELTRAALERIESLQPKLNAFITVTGEQAMEEARAAEREIARGSCRGALHGIPIAHKDLFDTKGVRTTMGSTIFKDRVPGGDAAVVEKLREAGAISLGKLGLHEWAYGTTSDNQWFGAIHNPWNLDRVPGGSSGGSGAAVASGLAFAATGSDTGGSIRMPAAACGCVGLMPTYGRVSLHNTLPLSWTLDHAGPLTRTVRDAAIALQAMAGHDPRDPYSVDMPVPDYLDGIESGPKELQIGVLKRFFGEDVEQDVLRLVRGAIEKLESHGAVVREVEFPQIAKYESAFGPVILADAAAYHADWFPSRRDEYSPQVSRLLGIGGAVSGPALAQALRVLQEARSGGADAVLEGVDVLALPTMPCAAPSIASTRAEDPSGRMAAFTSIFDLTGQPAIAVPCGLTADGLPASISFVARRWDEARLLRAARAYEMVRGAWVGPEV